MNAKVKACDSSIKIQGDINFDTVASLFENLQKNISNLKNQDVLIDFSEARQINSAALALIVEIRRYSQNSNVNIQFSNIPNKLIALASVSNIDNLL